MVDCLIQGKSVVMPKGPLCRIHPAYLKDRLTLRECTYSVLPFCEVMGLNFQMRHF